MAEKKIVGSKLDKKEKEKEISDIDTLFVQELQCDSSYLVVTEIR